MPRIDLTLTVRDLTTDDLGVCGWAGSSVPNELVRNCGLGTLLIAAAEQRIVARGLNRAELGVDERDQRPRPLYERLGYRAFGAKPVGWDTERPDGSTGRYETTAILLAKPLR